MRVLLSNMWFEVLKTWHTKVKRAVLNANKKNDVKEIFRTSSSAFHNAVNFFVYDIVLGLFNMGRADSNSEPGANQKN